MATMDMHQATRAPNPANFLDVGGGANAEQMVENGFKIILSDPNVRGILINIFGGILRCDRSGLRCCGGCRRRPECRVPVVVRMEGTNVKEEGRRILA